MKKLGGILFLSMVVIIVTSMLAGCGGGGGNTVATPSPTATTTATATATATETATATATPTATPTPTASLPFTLLPTLGVETTQIAYENFTANSSAFFTDYTSWSYQNGSSSDLSGGVVTGSVNSRLLTMTSTSSKTPHIVNSAMPGSADYSVSAYVKVGSSDPSAGVIARWVDKNNFYALRLRGSGVLNFGNSKVGGTSIGTGVIPDYTIPGFDINHWYKVTLIVRNSGADVVVSAYLDNVQVIAPTTISSASAKITAAGSPGLYCTINITTAQFAAFDSRNVTGN